MLSNSHRLKIVETQLSHSNKRKQHEADLTSGNSQRHETQARFPALRIAHRSPPQSPILTNKNKKAKFALLQ